MPIIKKRGQPTKFDDPTMTIIKMLAIRGFVDKDMAQILKITEQTLNNWKNAHPAFFESLKDWKCQADREVERSLYERATGYSVLEEKVFQHDGKIITHETLKHYPPDPTSMIFWLKNRQPDKWRDKHEVDANLNINVARKTYQDAIEMDTDG